jgi:hypothetical protein
VQWDTSDEPYEEDGIVSCRTRAKPVLVARGRVSTKYTTRRPPPKLRRVAHQPNRGSSQGSSGYRSI